MKKLIIRIKGNKIIIKTNDKKVFNYLMYEKRLFYNTKFKDFEIRFKGVKDLNKKLYDLLFGWYYEEI